jgi:hypothetical protein
MTPTEQAVWVALNDPENFGPLLEPTGPFKLELWNQDPVGNEGFSVDAIKALIPQMGTPTVFVVPDPAAGPNVYLVVDGNHRTEASFDLGVVPNVRVYDGDLADEIAGLSGQDFPNEEDGPVTLEFDPAASAAAPPPVPRSPADAAAAAVETTPNEVAVAIADAITAAQHGMVLEGIESAAAEVGAGVGYAADRRAGAARADGDSLLEENRRPRGRRHKPVAARRYRRRRKHPAARRADPRHAR